MLPLPRAGTSGTCKSETIELVTVTCHIGVKNKCPRAPAAFRSLLITGSGGASFASWQVWYVARHYKAALPTLPAVVPESSQKHLEFSPRTQLVSLIIITENCGRISISQCCPSVCLILMKALSQERLDGIS